MAAHL